MAEKKVARFSMLFLSVFLFSFPSRADGGGPLLLFINLYAFSVGQIWILAVEYFYLRRYINNVSWSVLLNWIFLANLASTVIGAVILPCLWFALTAGILMIASDSEFGKISFALGTWIVSDKSPYPYLAIAMTPIGFLLTFFPTVAIEYKVMDYIFKKKSVEFDRPKLKKAVIRMNLLSYTGLALVMGLYFLYPYLQK